MKSPSCTGQSASGSLRRTPASMPPARPSSLDQTPSCSRPSAASTARRRPGLADQGTDKDGFPVRRLAVCRSHPTIPHASGAEARAAAAGAEGVEPLGASAMGRSAPYVTPSTGRGRRCGPGCRRPAREATPAEESPAPVRLSGTRRPVARAPRRNAHSGRDCGAPTTSPPGVRDGGVGNGSSHQRWAVNDGPSLFSSFSFFSLHYDARTFSSLT